MPGNSVLEFEQEILDVGFRIFAQVDGTYLFEAYRLRAQIRTFSTN